LRQLHERHPDYLFARTSLAQTLLRERKMEEAEELLKPLLSRQRMHLSEFAAFCGAQIELCLAQKKVEGAFSWLDMWASIDPDHPALEQWRERLSFQGLWQRLRKRP
jgi:hypothetical protein